MLMSVCFLIHKMTDTKVMDPESTDLKIQKHPNHKEFIFVITLVCFSIALPGILGTYFYFNMDTSIRELPEFDLCRMVNTTYLWKVNSDPPSYFFGTIPEHPELVWGADSLGAIKSTFRQSDEKFTESIETDMEKESLNHRQIIKDKLTDDVSRKLIYNQNDESVAPTGFNEASNEWNQFSERYLTNQLALILIRISPEESFKRKSARSLETPSKYFDLLEKNPEGKFFTLMAWQQQTQCPTFWSNTVFTFLD